MIGILLQIGQGVAVTVNAGVIGKLMVQIVCQFPNIRDAIVVRVGIALGRIAWIESAAFFPTVQ